jgi:hypothetical protein
MRITGAKDHLSVKLCPARNSDPSQKDSEGQVKHARGRCGSSHARMNIAAGLPLASGAYLLRRARFAGTFFPFLRALDSPIAIACLRLFTFPPLPPGPLLAVPRLYRCISFSTSVPVLREYLRFRFLLSAMSLSWDRSPGINQQLKTIRARWLQVGGWRKVP